MFCKTIILSNSQNLASNSPKGILTLSEENRNITGKIRLYNVTALPQGTKIGLYIDDKVYTSNLDKKPNHYEFNISEYVDISKSVYCALIDTANNKKVLLEGGSFNGFYFSDSPFDAVMEAKDEDLEQTIDTALKTDTSCEACNCENCEYKKFFYKNYNQPQSHQNLNNLEQDEYYKSQDLGDCKTFNPPISEISFTDEYIDKIQSNIVDKLENNLFENIKSNIPNFDNSCINVQNTKNIEPQNSPSDKNAQEQKLEFLNDIIYQLDEMFEKYPSDEMLNSIIPDSKFISVDGDNPYVLGVIYEEKMLKYIAYGVPATYNSLPPKDFGKHYQWLPLNPRDVMSDGYFMIYQDVLNGSIVEINFEE